MDEIVYRIDSNLPSQKLIFKFASAFQWLMISNFFRRVMHKYMPNVEASRALPGFSAIIGSNIYAKNVYLNDTIFLDYAPIHIGEDTIFSGGNVLLTSTHDFHDFMTVRAKPIIIGSNVWITHRCIVLGGVTIGSNSVVGAGSVVTKDIPANVFAAGNPCKVIRNIDRPNIFSENH